MISIKDLLKALTREGVLADFIEIATALNLTTAAWQKSGEPILGLATILAAALANLWNGVILPLLGAWFLDYAAGDVLTLVSWAYYGVPRIQATFAGGSLVVENRGGNFYTLVDGDLRVQNAATGKTFRNVTGGTLGPWAGSGPFPTLELDFEADEAGAASTTPAGGIEAFPAPPVKAPEGVYALPNEAAFLGQDQELDESLRERCRLSTALYSLTGPAAKYEFVARSAKRPDGTAVNVNRVRVVSAGGGVVQVWLASPNGAASGDAMTEGTDVYVVNQAIQDQVVPAGITANVAAATEATFARTLTLRVRRESRVTEAEAEAAAAEQLAVFFSRLPIGGRHLTEGGQGYVLMDEVAAVAQAASPGIYHVVPDDPDDEELEVNEVAVPAITLAAVLVTQ
jgi:hypothetical protein